MAKKRKTTSAILAGATAAVLLLGGTFAWQSISQEAVNEASAVINPGGRLHDDFDGSNKDVYVENFADDEIFARVRLDEYFELVMNEGIPGAEKKDVITSYIDADTGESLESVKEDVKTYATHKFGEENATDAFWTWDTDGSKIFMPTFNKDKDSLDADINGTYAGLDGDPDQGEPYDDYIPEYADGTTLGGDAVYDYDFDSDDNDGITTIYEDHTAKSTQEGTLISMQEWLDMVNTAGDYDASVHGNYWVYDEDGWVYWSAPIPAGEATGLLLDSIELKDKLDDSWYYAINVVGQFVTRDDLGRGSETGFYNPSEGSKPSADALELLGMIGVDTTSIVTTDAALREALADGGDVIVKGTIESFNDETRDDINFNYDYLWHDGGDFSGGTLKLYNPSSRGLVINNEINWPEDGDGANAATLKDTEIEAMGVTAVYVQAIDAPVNLENVKITSDNAGLYVNIGTETVTLDNVTIDAANNDTWDGEDWFNSAVAVATPGEVVINSGYYEAENAVYIFSTGGKVTINGGTFVGDLKQSAGDKGALIIQGGTFSVDPSEFVDETAYTVRQNDDNTYTVVEGRYVSDVDSLKEALKGDSDVVLEGEVETTTTENEPSVGADKAYDLLWYTGGTLSGGTMNLNGGANFGLFINNEDGWQIEEAKPATLKDTTVNSTANAAISTQALSAPITLENVTVNAEKVGVYSEYTNLEDDALGTVTLKDCTVISANKSDKDWQNSAVAVAKSSPANGAGHMVIESGYYEGKYAAYVFSTGGLLEIKGGTFVGELRADAPQLVITGGTFSVDPTEFVDTANYEVVDNGDDTWTVQEIGSGDDEVATHYLTIGDFNDYHMIYASPNEKIVLSMDEAYTDGDLTSITVRETNTYTDLLEDEDYTYDSENQTLIITNTEVPGVQVWDANSSYMGTVSFAEPPGPMSFYVKIWNDWDDIENTEPLFVSDRYGDAFYEAHGEPDGIWFRVFDAEDNDITEKVTLSGAGLSNPTETWYTDDDEFSGPYLVLTRLGEGSSAVVNWNDESFHIYLYY